MGKSTYRRNPSSTVPFIKEARRSQPPPVDPAAGSLSTMPAASLENWEPRAVPAGLLETKGGGRLWKVVASCPPQW